jgi:hypothetical protein
MTVHCLEPKLYIFWRRHEHTVLKAKYVAHILSTDGRHQYQPELRGRRRKDKISSSFTQLYEKSQVMIESDQ